MDRAHIAARAHVLIALSLLATAAACHHPVHRPGEEWLSAIRFEGNHAIGDDDLREGLVLHRVQQHGSAPDPFLVTADRERIRGQYLRAGYLEVEVRSRVERAGDAITVIYTVAEGVRARTRVVINGLPDDPDVSLARVRERLPLRDGQPFSYEPYDGAKERLLVVLQDAGYAHAKLEARVFADRVHHEAIVDLDYAPGPKCRFGKVDIIGVGPELADAVRDRLTFDPGDQFSTAKLAESQRAIYDMRRFSTVQILPDKTGGDTVDIRITLSRGARHALSLGAGVGIDPAIYEVRGRAGYSIVDWPFPLAQVDLETRPAYAVLRDGSGYEPRIRALARLTRIDLFRPYLTGTIEAGYNFLTVEAYTSYGPLVRLGLESPIVFRQLRLRAGWSFERLDFRHVSPLVDPVLAHELGLDRTEQVGELEQTVALDLRDSPIEPHLGTYAEVRIDEGSKYVGGNFSFTRVTPEIRGYVPVPWSPLVLAARARYGTFYGDVPVTARYYSGGASLERGFSERRLAPTLSGMVGNEARSIPIGGTTLFESNLELRTELGRVRGMGVGGVVFVDAADVTNTRSELDLGHLHWAAGAGLRLYTVIGAVRLDVGYRLNRTGATEPEPGSHYAYHLSIGEAF